MVYDLAAILTDETTAQSTAPGGGCNIGRFINDLPPDDEAKMKKACADENVSAEAIRRVLSRIGLEVGPSTAKAHIRAARGALGCSCAKKGWL